MDPNQKKQALRMIPYGLYVLSAKSGSGAGEFATSTVNWVTQASFEPPLVAVGVKKDSVSHAVIKAASSFALNVLGKGQQDLAFAFFKHVEPEGDTIAGQPFTLGATTGAPILTSAPAYLECRLRETVEIGDHSVFVGEVVGAGVASPAEGRPDDGTLELRDLGEKTFYGG